MKYTGVKLKRISDKNNSKLNQRYKFWRKYHNIKYILERIKLEAKQGNYYAKFDGELDVFYLNESNIFDLLSDRGFFITYYEMTDRFVVKWDVSSNGFFTYLNKK